ncbi:MAG: hypothetical protein ACI88G_001719 [Woeseiaceae bacterium]
MSRPQKTKEEAPGWLEIFHIELKVVLLFCAKENQELVILTMRFAKKPSNCVFFGMIKELTPIADFTFGFIFVKKIA